MALIADLELDDTAAEFLAGKYWWVLPLALFTLAWIVGRWWVALVPGAIWTAAAVYLTLNDGWYGNGWGDGGVELNVANAFASFLAVALGLFTHRVWPGVFGRSRDSERDQRSNH